MPDTYAVIERQGDVRRFMESIGERDGFVVRPTQGSGGRGIVVIEQRRGDVWTTPGGSERTSADWNRAVNLVFRHGDHLYNFEGLRQYKAKFGPTWTPKYLASPGGLALPQILADVTALIGRKRADDR